MDFKNNDNLDRLLSEHFDGTLASQLGRTEAAFREQLNRASVPKRPLKIPFWLIGTFTTAAAATVAIAMLNPLSPDLGVVPGPSKPDVSQPTLIASTVAATSPNHTDLQYTSYQRTLDDGLVYLDDQTPARKLRRQAVQQIQWLDDDGKTLMQVTVPKEQVLVVECHKS